MCQILGTGNTVLNKTEIQNFMELIRSFSVFSLKFFLFILAFLKLKNHITKKGHKSLRLRL